MELRHLRYFVAVAREENVTRAAAELRVAQPSLSRQIRDLECELGFDLFEREAKSIHLTEAGHHFLDECRAILAQVDEAVKRTRAIAEGQAGALRVGFAPSLTVELMPKVLRAFSAAMPGVKVELHDLSTQEMLLGLREEALDVALLVKPRKGALAGLEFQDLMSIKSALAVPHDHPFARREAVTPEQVARETLVVYSKAHYPEYHDWIAPILATMKRPLSMQEHDASASLIAAIEAGHGVAILQQGLPLYTGKRLEVIPILPEPVPLVVGIAYRKAGKGAGSLACRAFVEGALKCRYPDDPS